MNNRNLLIFLILCIAAYFVLQWLNSGSEQTFRTEITDLDTSKIDKLWIKKGPSPAFRVERSGGNWMVHTGDRTVPADDRTVRTVLGTLQKLDVEAIVAKREDRWSEFELGEDEATRVKIFWGEEAVNDIYLGKFDFNRRARTASSYVRPAQESTVYKVEGMISMAFKQGANYFFNKTVLDIQEERITSIQYFRDDASSVRIERQDGSWVTDEGRQIDSASVQSYIQNFSPLQANELADMDERSFSGLTGDGHQLRIMTSSGSDIRLDAVYDLQSEKFILRSSQSPETMFASDSTGLFQRVFSSFPAGTGAAVETE